MKALLVALCAIVIVAGVWFYWAEQQKGDEQRDEVRCAMYGEDC